MSDPPPSSAPTLQPSPPPPIGFPQQQQQQLTHHLPSGSIIREYRKGNWTIEETLTLIRAKRLDDERRTRATPSKPGELRWKWVENYCWAHDCQRSQNQCNDKWDNLLRDYKKVRQYQSSDDHDLPSYWSMERHQRKLHNLPTNMSLDVFQALDDVVQRKHNIPKNLQQPPILGQPAEQRSVELSVALSPPPVSVHHALPAPEVAAPVEFSERSYSSETESSGNDVDSETKRRKVGKISASIVRSASVLAKAMRSSEERKERRHQQVMELEQRRLQVEETRNEMHREGVASLVAAMSNLSGAIQSLIATHYDQT